MGNYGTMKWRIELRSQSGIRVEQAGGGEHGETVETATTCNKRAGGTCSGVRTADRCGGIRTMTNKGGEASQVRSGRSRDYREAGDGRQGVVSEEGASRCIAMYGWIAEEGAGVARGIVVRGHYKSGRDPKEKPNLNRTSFGLTRKGLSLQQDG
ncbi:hypothetical protein BJ322DRAFT_1022236 [Thelephora terrestris]|uniref:Uncharacterized protein n=1 Tax=Thelephora terrestris TaxID=56493 RepID=A0A9P6H9S9_9AGAM|nr:hypothetical protein BJ322DRAFT_1022236 [Thelephora terrestris]